MLKKNPSNIKVASSKLNEYLITGCQPDDGVVVKAESFDKAIVEFGLLDFDKDEHKKVKKEIEKDLKKNPGKKISEKEYVYGDHTVRLLSKEKISFENWLKDKCFVDLNDHKQKNYDLLSENQKEKIKKQYENETSFDIKENNATPNN